MTCRKHDMITKVYSDGSDSPVHGEISREVENFYCGNNTPMKQEELHQGSIYLECSIIKPIAALAAECETLTLFLNFQNTIVTRTMAKELGCLQHATKGGQCNH